jgi:hypothetical protein
MCCSSTTITAGATDWFTTDGDGGLHGYASAYASESNSGYLGASAVSGFSSEWTDTLFVIGLPVGTPVELMLTKGRALEISKRY